MGDTIWREGGEIALPGSMLVFLRLCLVAGLYNGFAFFSLILLRPLPHPPPANVSSPFAFHVVVALLGAFMFLPVMMLPYWLALGFVYARNEWCRVLLYIGAGLIAMMTLAVSLRSGIGFLGLLGALLPGVAALVCLGQREARAFLHDTVPGFLARPPRY